MKIKKAHLWKTIFSSNLDNPVCVRGKNLKLSLDGTWYNQLLPSPSLIGSTILGGNGIDTVFEIKGRNKNDTFKIAYLFTDKYDRIHAQIYLVNQITEKSVSYVSTSSTIYNSVVPKDGPPKRIYQGPGSCDKKCECITSTMGKTQCRKVISNIWPSPKVEPPVCRLIDVGFPISNLYNQKPIFDVINYGVLVIKPKLICKKNKLYYEFDLKIPGYGISFDLQNLFPMVQSGQSPPTFTGTSRYLGIGVSGKGKIFVDKKSKWKSIQIKNANATSSKVEFTIMGNTNKPQSIVTQAIGNFNLTVSNNK